MPRSALVIGDRLDTDLAGARSGGYVGLHVLTGVSSGRDAVLAHPGERPHLLGADLLSVLVPHPEPQAGRRGLVDDAGRRRARRGGRLELTPSGTDDDAVVDLARSACAAVWAAVDAGEAVDASTVPEFAVRPR